MAKTSSFLPSLTRVSNKISSALTRGSSRLELYTLENDPAVDSLVLAVSGIVADTRWGQLRDPNRLSELLSSPTDSKGRRAEKRPFRCGGQALVTVQSSLKTACPYVVGRGFLPRPAAANIDKE